jgi:cyclophilin family peptidyl-prolyl cis-trans isomerase
MKTFKPIILVLLISFSYLSKAQTIVEWTTNHGSFRVELRDDLVPITAQNFIDLSNQKFYDGLIFHRIIDGFMIQDGCPLGNGSGGPGYEFEDEFHSDLIHDAAGILSMANSGPNTNGSQYFITLDETDWLDNLHSVFGKVTSGLDVVREIGHVSTDLNDRPLEDVVIDSIRVVTANRYINIVSPTSAINEIRGMVKVIKWDGHDISDIKIEYTLDGGINWSTIIEKTATNANEIEWLIPDELSSNAKIRITDIRNENYIVESEVFNIVENPVPIVKLIFDDPSIINESNPDNILVLGEKVKFKIQLQNNTSETFSNLNCTLLAAGNYFNIVDSTIVFLIVNAGESSISSDDFEIEIDDFIVGDFELKFEAQVYGNQIYSSVFSIPMLQVFNAELDDDDVPESNGNGDGIVEYNETVQFRPLINNKTSLTLNDVEAELKSSYWHVHIWNNVEGENDTIRSTNKYNVIEDVWTPIGATTNNVAPEADYVFDYWFDETYNFVVDLMVSAKVDINPDYTDESFMSDMIWKIPIEINKTSPDAPVSIEKIKDAFNIDVSPNPFHDEIVFDFDFTRNNSDNIEISIYNEIGKTVRNKVFRKVDNISKVVINSSDLPAGLYFGTIRSNEFSKTIKLVKTK